LNFSSAGAGPLNRTVSDPIRPDALVQMFSHKLLQIIQFFICRDTVGWVRCRVLAAADIVPEHTTCA